MAKKRTSLDNILPVEDTQQVREEETLQPTSEKPRKRPPSRHQLSVYLERPVYQQLRTIAFEEETKMHPLLLEGLDRVFADRGLPPISELMTKDDPE